MCSSRRFKHNYWIEQLNISQRSHIAPPIKAIVDVDCVHAESSVTVECDVNEMGKMCDPPNKFRAWLEKADPSSWRECHSQFVYNSDER